MTDELKPCPFCGGENLEEDAIGRVACSGCGATAPYGYHTTETWNTRADLPATDAQVFANEKVKALVEALERIAHLRATDPMDDPRVRALYGLVHDALTSGFLENNSWADDASAALAAMEADDE